MVSFTKALAVVVSFASSAYGLIPIDGVPGNTYPRYEIRTLQAQYPEQFALYIQALASMQTLDINNATSYYQIMGIHGEPNVPWDGVQGTAGGVGYCTHSMNLFPTWHRPYIALFEQQLSNSAKAIARLYPTATRQRYMDAADRLRSPYFDWAVAPANGKNAWPDAFSQQTLQIETGVGLRTRTNPLFSYRFQQPVSSFAQPWRSWPNTLRWPNGNSQGASSQTNLVIDTFNRNRVGLRQGLFSWFVNCRTYNEMSNDQDANTSPGCGNSLESLHNSVHVYIGGTSDPAGHMTMVRYSSFDPVFMLHHTNIDRLFAMWQVIYPNAYVVPQRSAVTTYTIQAGSTQDVNSALQPFRNRYGFWWTSNGARNIETFHYTYPEVIAAGGNAGRMQGQVNNLYGGSATVRASKRSVPGSLISRQIVNKIVPDVLKAANGSLFQYNADVTTSKYALGGTYGIYFFLGNPTTTDPKKFAYDENLVGSYGVLASDNMQGNDVVTSSTVPLSEALLDRVTGGKLSALNLLAVVPYLQKNLQWKIVGPDGTERDPASVPDFKVTVTGSTLKPNSILEEFPVWSKFFPLRQVTAGKPGGYQ